MRALPLLVVAAVVPCTGAPRHSVQTGAGGATAAARVPAGASADTAAVRRLCVAPDSVLAGRAACVLRNQAPFRLF